MILRNEVRETESVRDKHIKECEKLVRRVLLNFKLIAIALIAHTIWCDKISLFFAFSFFCCFGIDLIESLFKYYKLKEGRRRNEH